MALITAQHINLLIENGIDPKEIACHLSSFHHHLILEKIFGKCLILQGTSQVTKIFWPYHFAN